jgi:2-polyprenyl-3-methyl-5-hydroxy-6-metoxy-1,4-benzoquinol methylase
MSSEKELWSRVTDMLGSGEKELGSHWTYNLWNDPKRLGFVLSRYKFAAKMASAGRRVLELGCSEGIGAPILAEHAIAYTGVDLDEPAIEAARRNFPGERFTFVAGDFLDKPVGAFDAVVSLDVVEHIQPDAAQLFFDAIATNLDGDGVAVVGTPNATSEAYASEASRRGHVNLYEAPRLKESMERLFHNVFMFGINDEIVHTGFAPMAHYLVAVGCYAR